jgi:glutamate racemase
VTARDSIGVFDSGIGGLTVVAALTKALPDERILYFGDTARVPYGPKSPETVRRYAKEISGWLLGEGVKAVVVACNTATAHALPELQASLPVPVIGVIEPGARAAVENARGDVIGVIGTAGTIASGAYARAIHSLEPSAKVVSQACPLFVPLVEEGWLDHPATRIVAHEYLEPLRAAHVRALVLGCTHYPLLKSLIGEMMGRDVRLVDSAEATAAETARVLEAGGLRAPPAAGDITHRFVATDASSQFLRLGQRFLGSAIERVEQVSVG